MPPVKRHARELAERILLAAEAASTEPLVTPMQLADLFRPYSEGQDYERLMVAGLDRNHRLIDLEPALTIGSSGFTIVDPPQILRWVLTRKRPVHTFALCHNHPSGDPSPSSQDRDVTHRMVSAGRAIGVPMLDHVILGRTGEYRSYAQDGGWEYHP